MEILYWHDSVTLGRAMFKYITLKDYLIPRKEKGKMSFIDITKNLMKSLYQIYLSLFRNLLSFIDTYNSLKHQNRCDNVRLSFYAHDIRHLEKFRFKHWLLNS